MTRRKLEQPPERIKINGMIKVNPAYYQFKKMDPRYRELRRKNCLRHYHRVKDNIFNLLGNKCNNPNCPISRSKLDKRCLQIDLVNNDGYKDLRLGGRRGGNSSLYSRILKELRNGSQDYTLLCPYCNWLKRFLKIRRFGE